MVYFVRRRPPLELATSNKGQGVSTATERGFDGLQLGWLQRARDGAGTCAGAA
jgi:hypothetical protein